LGVHDLGLYQCWVTNKNLLHFMFLYIHVIQMNGKKGKAMHEKQLSLTWVLLRVSFIRFLLQHKIDFLVNYLVAFIIMFIAYSIDIVKNNSTKTQRMNNFENWFLFSLELMDSYNL
jgi:hypothetical protein